MTETASLLYRFCLMSTEPRYNIAQFVPFRFVLYYLTTKLDRNTLRLFPFTSA